MYSQNRNFGAFSVITNALNYLCVVFALYYNGLKWCANGLKWYANSASMASVYSKLDPSYVVRMGHFPCVP